MVTAVSPTMDHCQGANLCSCLFFQSEPSPSETLGILSFDAAKTMCRLVSLYKSLSDAEFYRLRRRIIRSKGVSRLNSQDECFLLNLACAEFLEDLNLAAAAVSRFGRRCSDKALGHFDAVYADMKHGVVDIRKLEFGTRNIERMIEKTEKLVQSTRNLHKAMESLSEMEVSEKKIQRWRNIRANHGLKVKVECFNDRILFHRKQVQHYKQVSLWNQSFDKVVGLMARIICIIYGRICSVFGSFVTGITKNNYVRRVFRPNFENCCCRIEHRELYETNLCLFDQNGESLKKRGVVLKSNRTGVIKFPNGHGGERNGCDGEVAKNNRVMRRAPPSTVGGAGLSMRYANVVLFVERLIHAAAAASEEVRVVLYEMLPERLKVKLRVKLRNEWVKWEEISKEGEDERKVVAVRWHHVVDEVMDWLSPVAHDTVRWQAERNLEKQKFDTKPTVLLLQTLHYSDLEKVEEAIVEVLVGLSCIYWYHKERQSESVGDGERG